MKTSQTNNLVGLKSEVFGAFDFTSKTFLPSKSIT